MSEVHVNITGANSSQVVFHNPGKAPDVPGAGQTVVAATKTAGQPNGKVLGQVSGTTCIISNPA